MTAYDDLLDSAREIHLIESTAAILAWDQETKMPPGGVEHRAKQLALLASLGHGRASDPRIGELLSKCGEAAGDSERDANVREIRRSYERCVKLPPELVRELAETTSLAQHEWAAARKDSDFGKFRPWLEKLVALARQKAECLAGDGGELWDALADGFEPGLTAAAVAELFTPLRPQLSALIAELRDRGAAPSDEFKQLALPIDRQEAFVRFVSKSIGFDFERGRIDRSTHPFCGGSHSGDVRITTRFHEHDVIDALGSTMHESGHGIYEQGLRRDRTGTPMGDAVSLGIHESQSRLWENHVGRSRAFWEWCHPHLAKFFGSATAAFDADAAYAAANVVTPSLIRVEADEATYDLHVMVRFELERALLRGDFEAADVPGAWNEKYRELLGVDVPDDARGCLQDVHWSCGLFGYFPTYTLGNLYAAQFMAAARRAIPDLEEQISRGEFTPLRTWLNDNVHRHGKRYRPAELCERATGSALSSQPFLEYLSGKLRPLYGI